MSVRNTVIACGLLALAAVARAEEPAPAPAGEPVQMTAEQFEASLHYRQGSIALSGGKATLEVPASFRYLDPAEAARLLEQGWGNPPGAETLGMLIPVDLSPLSEHGWGVVISYDEDGHISDEDADGIDYDAMLADLQSGEAEVNAEREKQGYASLHLVGWAEAPYYDGATRKLHWAKELQFGGNEGHTLNYNVRVLGREGVLVLNAVAGMDQFTGVKSNMADVVAMANFTPGNTYADFDEGTDKVAGYGLAALVGGAAAAKSGLLAKLLALVVAFKKLIVAGFIALAAGVRSLLGRSKKS